MSGSVATSLASLVVSVCEDVIFFPASKLLSNLIFMCWSFDKMFDVMSLDCLLDAHCF